MSHEDIRNRHFEHLNKYRRSVEYAEYAKTIGSAVPQEPLPTLLGNRWEIDREVYHEFLEMLPPLGWRNGTFFMSEFTFDDVTAKFSQEGDKYYCEYARYPSRKETPALPIETPWGASQSAREVAPGIVRYDTASHGGYFVSPERVAEMPEPLRKFQPWAGPNWYEEDCDWCVVALAFPQFFPDDWIPDALTALKRYKPEVYAQVSAMRGEGRSA